MPVAPAPHSGAELAVAPWQGWHPPFPSCSLGDIGGECVLGLRPGSRPSPVTPAPLAQAVI